MWQHISKYFDKVSWICKAFWLYKHREKMNLFWNILKIFLILFLLNIQPLLSKISQTKIILVFLFYLPKVEKSVIKSKLAAIVRCLLGWAILGFYNYNIAYICPICASLIILYYGNSVSFWNTIAIFYYIPKPPFSPSCFTLFEKSWKVICWSQMA